MSQKVFVIGANAHGECGVDNAHNLSQLTELSSTVNINQIYNGNGYAIYRDNKNNLYTSGDNKHYSCCINEPVEHITKLKEIDYFRNKTESQAKSDDAKSDTKVKTKKRKNKKKTTKKDNTKTKQEEKRETPKPSIKIKKICVSVSGYCSFFVSENNKVYANGNNRKFQLGYSRKQSEWWSKGFKYNCEPKNITSICKNLIDIKSSANYSIALRMSDQAIMFLYCNRNKYERGLQINDDVLELIIRYVGVLTDTNCAVYLAGNGRSGWNPVHKFKRKDIIKIDSGVEHSLALDSDGVLWAWGNNRYLQCGGDMDTKDVKEASEVRYFFGNKIQVKDIKSGWNHNLVLDSKNKVYSFGRNNFGQCGYSGDDLNDISEVRLIDAFKDCEVKEIACGGNHSYVKTKDGRHFLFGKNVQNQCVTNDGRESVFKPFCINDMVKEKTKGEIKKVTLGVDNTQIIVTV